MSEKLNALNVLVREPTLYETNSRLCKQFNRRCDVS